jgi:LmbE family N-acetylglucosaminyl deacetylase
MFTLGRPLDSSEVGASAIVFSPHQDDETLGCGGTIARKRHAGATVTVVFMTDGSASHRRLMSANALRSLRRGEALAACDVLGVAERDVHFLDFADGRLDEEHADAVRRVAQLLRDRPCEQVFVPYRADTTADHQAAHAIVLSALRQLRNRATIYEYPVWFWAHWPWIPKPATSRQGALDHWHVSARSWLLSMRELRSFVLIEDVLEQKRLALAQHRSQTTRLVPGTDWPILSDVGHGEFVQCFFQPRELFYRHTIDSIASDATPRAQERA